jgi:myo-inositol 2-dehydrogenase/D-chiro-inositol 1-dehydrogenase
MGKKLRLAVVGAGMMAGMRTRALVETGDVVLVGVAARNAVNAKKLAELWDCPFSTDDYPALLQQEPDIVLVEVPHRLQDHVVCWALEHKLHVLVGSCMASSGAALASIRELAERHQRIVEGGFEARYKEVWKQARQFIASGALGEVAAIQASACWAARPDSWYYSQEESAGMPLTHMSYAFLNPLTWLFGVPQKIAAFANRKGIHREGMVREVTCSANLEYKNGILCQLLASYVQYPSYPSAWKLYVHGTDGALEIFPGEFDCGHLIHHTRHREPARMHFENADNPFSLQALAFVQAIRGEENRLQNSIDEASADVQIATAIVSSVTEGKTIILDRI